MTATSVLSVVAEIYPLVKTGGLADVAGALPPALAAEGVAVHSLIPGYPAVLSALASAAMVHRFDELFGGPATLVAGMSAGLRLFAIDAPHLYARPGSPYAGPDGVDWPDNARRFAALGWVAAELGRGALPGFVPDVVHAHDWQAALAPVYLHYGETRAAGGGRPGTVMTVHNLAFQGQFPPNLLAALRLPPEAFSLDGVEYYGSIGFLKGGLRLADRITTVSPTYAEEIGTPVGGMGLAGLLRTRAPIVSGILNGIDETVWNPAADRHLAAPFDAARTGARALSRQALRTRLGLAPDPETPLFGVVSRLTWQKGMDLLLEALPALLATGGQLGVLGVGERALEDGFAAAAAQHPGQVGVRFGYDEPLAHLIQGGSDLLLVPSRFEPCGLTQLCALRYGALPLVARVGGL
ncbi:MAG: glycogen synthase GlgA, partial [Pseudomonadota bacterium]|nr:glycogen synthase GlgA [Pseudomonadota bacterium]